MSLMFLKKTIPLLTTFSRNSEVLLSCRVNTHSCLNSYLFKYVLFCYIYDLENVPYFITGDVAITFVYNNGNHDTCMVELQTCVTQSAAFQINVSEFDMPVYLECNLMLMDSTPVSFDGLEPLVLMFVSFVNIFFYINGSCFGDL